MNDIREPRLTLCDDILPKPTRLADLLREFSIPRLEDKPQNPIVSSLERTRIQPLPRLTVDEHRSSLPSLDSKSEKKKSENEDIWIQVKDIGLERKGCLVSWDTLRDAYHSSGISSPFVSEQAPPVSEAARSPSRLLASTSGKKVESITTAGLYEELELILVGCPSVLHEWHATEERLVPTSDSEMQMNLLIDGVDEVASDSYFSHFAIFGTLYRRLDILVEDLRKFTHDDNSATFAFAHCLSSVLEWIKREVMGTLSNARDSLCDVWMSLQEVQAVLTALASLCSRDVHIDPRSYRTIPRTSQGLLSHVYDFLCLQLEQQSPRLVRTILSYILTVTSRPYFRTLSHTIGLLNIDEMLADARRKAARTQADGILMEEDEEELDDEFESENGTKELFPSFISGEIRAAIVAAERSIRILASPEFEAGQRIDLPGFRRLEWVWSEEGVARRVLEQGNDLLEPDPMETGRAAIRQQQAAPMRKYKPELAGLALYDLEPDTCRHDLDASLTDFINNFPTHLPALTPTLPLLSDHILSPIIAQANALGRAALQHFLAPGTFLHFRAHLIVLRAYLLLAAPSFKARLAAALFSDAQADEEEDEGAYENPMAITIRTRARNANWRENQEKRSGRSASRKRVDRLWPVGLAFGLTRQAEWPPKASELSFYLRRVIMDSLDHVRESENMFEDAQHKDELGDGAFWDEGENRIGFAIRDLPMDSGGEKWLDATLIEALDFLYVQYKPPDPLRCLITEDILSKYQRIFAFLLRLLRVEAAMRAVFRMTRPCSIGYVFANHPETQTLVLHFRFSAQAFLTAFSAYVADTAIRGNVDPFIARVRYAEIAAASRSDEHIGPFADVYALMQRHSRVLDSVLAACLLRGAQRAVGDILRALLEAILEFSVLVGNAYKFKTSGIRSQAFNEERAAQRVEALFAKFHKTRYALVKALQKIAERGLKPFTKENVGPSGEKQPSSAGGMEALVDLLLRIGDAGDRKK